MIQRQETLTIALILLLLGTSLGLVTIADARSLEPSLGLSDSLSRDYWPTDDWQTSAPEEQGMDASKLEDMVEFINSTDQSVHSIVVVRHGYIVFEEDFTPGTTVGRTRSISGTHYLYSTTKSFTSCLIGMAIDQGYIDNVSQKVLSLFPNHTIANYDERKDQITIENLLTMRSGLSWDESSAPYSSPENDVYHLNNDPEGGVQYALGLPMVADPDEVFHYNTGASHLLSGIVQETTGMTSLEFANENLFEPLGITTFYWPADRQGVNFGGYDLQLRPRDMAKFGYLFLNNGTWDGEQLVSENWVNASTTTVTHLDDYHGYGYQWWTLPSIGVYHTAGLYGQYIFVAPDHDLVVAFTSGYPLNTNPQCIQMLDEYLLPAILEEIPQIDRSDAALIGILVVLVVPAIIFAGIWIKKK
jgi:CubicO group peptidase (beta-lactamase class C family)